MLLKSCQRLLRDAADTLQDLMIYQMLLGYSVDEC